MLGKRKAQELEEAANANERSADAGADEAGASQGAAKHVRRESESSEGSSSDEDSSEAGSSDDSSDTQFSQRLAAWKAIFHNHFLNGNADKAFHKDGIEYPTIFHGFYELNKDEIEMLLDLIPLALEYATADELRAALEREGLKVRLMGKRDARKALESLYPRARRVILDDDASSDGYDAESESGAVELSPEQKLALLIDVINKRVIDKPFTDSEGNEYITIFNYLYEQEGFADLLGRVMQRFEGNATAKGAIIRALGFAELQDKPELAPLIRRFYPLLAAYSSAASAHSGLGGVAAPAPAAFAASSSAATARSLVQPQAMGGVAAPAAAPAHARPVAPAAAQAAPAQAPGPMPALAPNRLALGLWAQFPPLPPLPPFLREPPADLDVAALPAAPTAAPAQAQAAPAQAQAPRLGFRIMTMDELRAFNAAQRRQPPLAPPAPGRPALVAGARGQLGRGIVAGGADRGPNGGAGAPQGPRFVTDAELRRRAEWAEAEAEEAEEARRNGRNTPLTMARPKPISDVKFNFKSINRPLRGPFL